MLPERKGLQRLFIARIWDAMPVTQGYLGAHHGMAVP